MNAASTPAASPMPRTLLATPAPQVPGEPASAGGPAIARDAATMKFTIVTCTRNSVATLADTIASVRRQTWTNVEHLFVDGGSTDGTLEMIREMAPDARILENITGGISRAMNVGIENATGDVIAHLHGDDFYWDEHVLARVAQAMQRTGAEWVFGHLQHFTTEQTFRDEGPRGLKPFSYWRYAAQFVSMVHPSVFISKRAFDEVGLFDTELRYAMDIDLFLRVAKRFEPAQVEETLAVFRLHDGSTSHSNQDASRWEEVVVRWRHAGHSPTAFAVFMARVSKRAVLRTLGLSTY
jgi:glycosyltransferase involved in cell wall biosynthesis